MHQLCGVNLDRVTLQLRRHQREFRGVVRLERVLVTAAVLLAFARAIGETMAVTLAAGLTPKLTINPLESIQTMTAYIVQVSLGDTPAGTIEYQTIFAVGLVLFLITLTINLVAQRMLARFRSAYE